MKYLPSCILLASFCFVGLTTIQSLCNLAAGLLLAYLAFRVPSVPLIYSPVIEPPEPVFATFLEDGGDESSNKGFDYD